MVDPADAGRVPTGVGRNVGEVNGLEITAATAGAMMGAGWLLSLRLRDVSIVDPLWGLTYVAAAWAMWLWAEGTVTGRGWLVLAMVTVWGMRLGIHLTVRKRGEPEDRRYTAMRRGRRRFEWWSLVMVFGLQAALVVVVSLPVQAVLGNLGGNPGLTSTTWTYIRTQTSILGGSAGHPALGPLDWIGCAVWSVGLAFESVADEQLRRFRSNRLNRSGVLERGLWRYSRHPNYFGDFLIWWGIYLTAASAGATWTIAGPLVMSVLLLRVSGVRLLERTIDERRPGYAGYVQRTSAFIPRPPRRVPADPPPGAVPPPADGTSTDR